MLLCALTQSQHLPIYGCSVFLAQFMQEIPSEGICFSHIGVRTTDKNAAASEKLLQFVKPLIKAAWITHLV